MSGAALSGSAATKPRSPAGIAAGSAAAASGLASSANMMTMAAQPSPAGRKRPPIALLLPDPDQQRAMTATPPSFDPNQLWGGRFARGPAAIMARINASIGFDRALSTQDIAASKA